MTPKVYVFFIIFLTNTRSFSQAEKEHPMYRIEKIDSNLIGKTVKHAVKILGIDTNWRSISEPPGMLRGISIFGNDDCQIYIYVKKKGVRPRGKRPETSNDYRVLLWKQLRFDRIIGVSWLSRGKCGHVGTVIGHYRFDKFGPCG